MLALALSLSSSLSMPQEPAPVAGITRELAVARAAAIRDLRYELSFALQTPVTKVEGTASITFTLADAWPAATPLVLDFGGSSVAAVHVNGAALQLAASNDHLLVPGDHLRQGANTIELRCESAAAATGTPLTVYRDPADGSEYCYTLLVPADAHRLFPCFDQPDLKARFALQLELPAAWTAIGNGKGTAEPAGEGRQRWRFAESAKLPTYLFAFACGPFAVVEAAPLEAPGLGDGERLRILLRPSQRPHADLAAIERLHVEGLRWLCDYFAVDYPFGKLDIALIPGFPYGGMEHAGAIFYRERALVFDHPPTDGELVRRSTLVYHELSHQWFGNLVTMKWFDDLWLKEGFATFVAYRAMEVLEPQRRSWLRFLQRVKPRAYEVDVTPGTTPVFQQLQNLADAKSAYGAIVYNKAPAVLRELDDRLGAKAFRTGLTQFLRDHSFGNATWQDLAKALEAAAHVDLRRWSDRWLLAPSLPQVRVAWTRGADGIVTEAELLQRAVTDGGGGADAEGQWPLHVELFAVDDAGRWRRCEVTSDAARAPIDGLVGSKEIACVVANPGDVAYGQFLPDARSRAWIAAHAPSVEDPLLRAVMVAAMFEAVREAELAPVEFCSLALALVEREDDPDTHGWLLDMLGTCLGRYLDDAVADRLRGETTALLLRQLRGDGGDGRKLQTFRFLARNGAGPEVAALCRAAVAGAELPAGLAVGREDRFLALAALLAGSVDPTLGAPEAAALTAQLTESCKGQDLGRELFLARAATASAATKQEYFERFLQVDGPPEQWCQDSLGWFHWRGQDALTMPFLRQALDRAMWVKANRRIFFMPAWLDAFVNGHSDAEALQTVDAFLAEARIDADVRGKLLQSRDGLARAVRIRAAFAAPR